MRALSLLRPLQRVNAAGNRTPESHALQLQQVHEAAHWPHTIMVFCLSPAKGVGFTKIRAKHCTGCGPVTSMSRLLHVQQETAALWPSSFLMKLPSIAFQMYLRTDYLTGHPLHAAASTHTPLSVLPAAT